VERRKFIMVGGGVAAAAAVGAAGSRLGSGVGTEGRLSALASELGLSGDEARGALQTVVPPGKYVTGTIWLRSNITLHLEAGAALLGVQDVEAFPKWTPRWEGPRSTTRAALICGEELENVAITGRGTIDGRGEMWWKLRKQVEPTAHIQRPRLIRLVDCRNVLIEGITVTRSPSWTINPVACENVTVHKVTVKNPADSPNTDGINPDSCRNVRISDCHIDVGDDCVTLKSGMNELGRKMGRPDENITQAP